MTTYEIVMDAFKTLGREKTREIVYGMAESHYEAIAMQKFIDSRMDIVRDDILKKLKGETV